MTAEEAEKPHTAAGESPEEAAGEGKAPDTFWKRHGPTIGLAVLVIYVILLAIGTVAEIFEIQSILDWWIFRPPGRK